MNRSDYATGKSFGLGFGAYKKVVCPGWETAGRGQAGHGPGEPLWFDRLDPKTNNVKTHAIGKAPRWARSKYYLLPEYISI
jgi:hypothetical protein